MKKQLLIGTALLAALAAFPQNGRNIRPSGKYDCSQERAQKFAIGVSEPTATSPMYGSGQVLNNYYGAKPAAPSNNWSLLCGSMNCYGMLGSGQKPLQYNPALNAVSFIHRKSVTYQPIPAVPSTAEPGIIVAEISSDWGTTWDSTCLYANTVDWGRYPNGAIYNPNGNTSLANAYIVGCGPTVGSASFSGNWYASKNLATFDKTASTATGAQQFFSYTGPYPPNMAQHGWMRNGFNSTTDGIVRAVGMVSDDISGLTSIRGYAVATGTFNGTAFDWRLDTIIPPVKLQPDGSKWIWTDAQMAWNPSGTVGYVVGGVARTGGVASNSGIQPIVYKMDRTTNPAATWSMVTQIDFNSPTMTIVPSYCSQQPVTQPVVTGDYVGIPYLVDFDLAVDGNNDLHLAAVFRSGASDHPDSLNYISQYTTSINPSEQYAWAHVDGSRPYIWDFIGDGVAPWKLVLVDSMSSEAPSSTSGRPGYSENPWDPSGTNSAKIEVESRLQLGRTPDGKYITFSWAESDSSYTFNAFKWNNLPDIKTRLMAINSGTAMYVMDVSQISGANPKQNVTQYDNNVRTRATLHYMSPTTGAASEYTSVTSFYTVEINTPLTVTNSNPYSQLTNNATWYGAVRVAYQYTQTSTVGLDEKPDVFAGSFIYPNPAQNSANLVVHLPASSNLSVDIINLMGQNMKSSASRANIGENNIPLDLSGLSAGVYLVNIKAGDARATKKLIVE